MSYFLLQVTIFVPTFVVVTLYFFFLKWDPQTEYTLGQIWVIP